MSRRAIPKSIVLIAGVFVVIGATILAQQPQAPGSPAPYGQPSGGRVGGGMADVGAGGAPATAVAQAPAQGPQGRGAPAAAAPAGPAAQINGPLSLILGPTGEVKKIDFGNPKAPGTDTYYDDIPIEEWPPDEFISNPDREFDWRELKGWHFVPNITSIKILGNRKVKPGDSIRFEGIVQDVTGTQNRMGLTYYGPFGRRSTIGVAMTPVTPGSNIFRGELRIPAYAEPGIYRPTEGSASNDTRHSKVFWADHHKGMRDLEFEVAADMNTDVIPPTIHWVKVNPLDAPEGQIRTQRVQDPIPVYARITDNKSTLQSVTVRFVSPKSTHFIEARLNKVVGKPDIYGAMLSIPQWWEGGEYRLLSMWARDAAGKETMIFQTSHPALKTAKVNLTNEPANVDKVAPTLFSVWVDKETARLGEAVTVNAVITDDKSGVGTVAVMFSPNPSYIDRVRVHLKPVPKVDVVQKSGLDISANLWTGTLETIPWFEPGQWSIDRIVARDNADNYLDLLPDAAPEIAQVKVNFTGGNNLREQMTQNRKGMVANTAPQTAPAPAAPAPPAANPQMSGQQPGKIRRVDMVAPHPPRGACLNCHEP